MAQQRAPAVARAVRPTTMETTKRPRPKHMTVSPDLARRFAFEYLKDFNAARAYRRAKGTTNAKTAAVGGWRLLKNPRVQAVVQAGERHVLRTAERTHADCDGDGLSREGAVEELSTAQQRATAAARAVRPTTMETTKRPRPKHMTVSPDLAQRFALEYLKDLNATQAYMRAKGTTNAKTAAVGGWRLLKNPHVQAVVQAGERHVLRTAERTAAQWVAELWAEVLFDPMDLCDANGKLLPIHKMPPAARTCITGIRVRRANLGRKGGKRIVGELHCFTFSNKARTLEMLGKHYGLFDQKGDTRHDNSDRLIAQIQHQRQRLADEKNRKLAEEQKNQHEK